MNEKDLFGYITLLREYMDWFAWNYSKMARLEPKIAMHKLNKAKDVKPVKQGQRRTNPVIIDKIEREVQKHKDVGFIHEE